MDTSEVWANLGLLACGYAYVMLVIFLTGKLSHRLSKNASRKFLHVMIGNLPFLIPFFTYNSFPLNFPFFIAAPFILVTFMATPYIPVKSIREKMSGLMEVTGGGHSLGLFLYAISYTILAALFSAKPYVIAAGILPMAYGDAAASLVGEKFGKTKFRIFCTKSLEGSAAMFLFGFAAFAASLLFFSFLYPIPLLNSILAALGVAAIAAVAEALTPRGFDNITVPIFSAAVFIILMGAI